jgi:signal transduction histidine kinase
LVKNAEQAMTGERPGRIELRLQRMGRVLRVEVEDNGSGIPEDMKDRVFVPNFTTKGSGMGLGLAMSKNIIESAAGRIGFESREGEGTVFFVELPLYEAGHAGRQNS